MSCFHVSVQLRARWSHVLSGLHALLCWSVVFGSRHSCLEFRFRVGVWTLVLRVEWVWGLEFARPCALLSTCVLWCCTAACINVMSCTVWHTACVFHWLRAFMLSCLLWTCGLWVFSLAACACPAFHMASEYVLLAMCLCFVLCEHMAFILVFCVPCALLSIFLDPTHLVSWLLVNLPHLCPTSRYPPHLLPL